MTSEYSTYEYKHVAVRRVKPAGGYFKQTLVTRGLTSVSLIL